MFFTILPCFLLKPRRERQESLSAFSFSSHLLWAYIFTVDDLETVRKLGMYNKSNTLLLGRHNHPLVTETSFPFPAKQECFFSKPKQKPRGSSFNEGSSLSTRNRTHTHKEEYRIRQSSTLKVYSDNLRGSGNCYKFSNVIDDVCELPCFQRVPQG